METQALSGTGGIGIGPVRTAASPGEGATAHVDIPELDRSAPSQEDGGVKEGAGIEEGRLDVSA